jgi:3-dehydroquinate dehydratase
MTSVQLIDRIHECRTAVEAGDSLGAVHNADAHTRASVALHQLTQTG